MERKIILINGACGGIGQGLMSMFIEKGDSLILLGRDRDKLQHLYESFKIKLQKDQFIKPFTYDLLDTNYTDLLVEFLSKNTLTPDVFVNAAGIVIRGNMHEVSYDLWKDAIDTNLLGVINLTSKVTKLMQINKKSGAVVLVNGILSRQPDSNLIINSTITGAVANFAKAISKDLIKYGIRVNIVNPGVTNTPLYEKIRNQIADKNGLTTQEVDNIFNNKTAMNRIADINEVVNAIEFLCSEKASYINGTFITVDGGSSSSY
ncbi:MAG: SDR family oxidoreductase [Pseudomonadota bacterium]|jgi:2,3-dihydro-2,3-dihydroxybenzoate dehydrogenase